jgi:hypothetical protein
VTNWTREALYSINTANTGIYPVTFLQFISLPAAVLYDPEFGYTKGKRLSYSPKGEDRPWGSPIRRVFFSSGVRRSGREADNSSLFNAEVKNEWSYIFTPLTHFYGLMRKNLTFTCF